MVGVKLYVQTLSSRFGQDFEVEVDSEVGCWCLVGVMYKYNI